MVYNYYLQFLEYIGKHIKDLKNDLVLFPWDSLCVIFYNPKSEKVGTVWKTQIKKESSDF